MRIKSLIAIAVLVGCQTEAAKPIPVTQPAETPTIVAPVVPSGELPEMSIYQLDSTWTTQDKAHIKLVTFRGEPVVTAMFFGSCRTACPTIIADMKRIEKAAGPKATEKTKYVLITFDPKVDTPDALKELETKFHLDSDRWVFLHGDEGSIREVASVLNVQYREVSEGQFSHTNLITLLDPNGVVTTKIEGLKQPVEPLVTSLNKIAGDS
jgi:protein SCO1/2